MLGCVFTPGATHTHAALAIAATKSCSCPDVSAKLLGRDSSLGACLGQMHGALSELELAAVQCTGLLAHSAARSTFHPAA